MKKNETTKQNSFFFSLGEFEKFALCGCIKKGTPLQLSSEDF